MCRKENILDCTETDQEVTLDIKVDSRSVDYFTELEGVKEVR